MVALNTPVCEFNNPAIPFELKSCDGKIYNLEDCVGPNGLLIMFICNHCPYVQSIITDLVVVADNLYKNGVYPVAIMSNDWHAYPDDSPNNMMKFVKENHIKFPYLIDSSQEIAKQYGAVCTPDFFGYNKNLELQYRGRFDARGMNRVNEFKQNGSELEHAMLQVAVTGQGPREQNPSIGCSIKWKEVKQK